MAEGIVLFLCDTGWSFGKLRKAAGGERMKLDKKDLLLYAVTDRSWLDGRTLYEQVQQALQGGVTMLQLREKNRSGQELFHEAMQIKNLCARYEVPFIINDNVFLAQETDADGVHLGQNDMDAGSARARLGPDKIIGVTARTVQQALAAQAQGADYIGTGAVFATATKQDAQVIGPKQLKGICNAVTIPAVAIGGITGENMAELSGSGICGIAVVSALFARPDIRLAAEQLRKKAEGMIWNHFTGNL